MSAEHGGGMSAEHRGECLLSIGGISAEHRGACLLSIGGHVC